MDKFERHILNMPILEMQEIFGNISECKSKIGYGLANGIMFDTKLNSAWPIEQLGSRIAQGRLIWLRVR